MTMIYQFQKCNLYIFEFVARSPLMFSVVASDTVLSPRFRPHPNGQGIWTPHHGVGCSSGGQDLGKANGPMDQWTWNDLKHFEIRSPKLRGLKVS